MYTPNSFAPNSICRSAIRILCAVTALLVPIAAIASPPAAPAGWTQIYAEDFNTNIPVGGFVSGNNAHLLSSCAAYPVYGNRLTTYIDGVHDTDGISERYPSKTMSVSNSNLDIYMHTEDINGVATALGATMKPILPNPPYTNGFIYGRCSARMRIVNDSHPGAMPPGWGGVWMLWEDSETPAWPTQGEVDFPEGSWGGQTAFNAHWAKAGGTQADKDSGQMSVDWNNWHTFTTEWMPGSLKFYLDGAPVGTSTTLVPSIYPLHYMFQCGSSNWGILTDSNGKKYIDPNSNGHVQIDWVTVDMPKRSVSVDFQGGSAYSGTPAVMGPAEVAGVAPASNWNTAPGVSGTLTGLKDQGAINTGAQVTWSANAMSSDPITETAGNNRMMKGYVLTSNTSTTNVQFTGLPSWVTANGYDVYVYFDCISNGATRTGTYTISSTSITGTDAHAEFGGTFIQSSGSTPGNYVKFTNLTTTGFTLTATPATSTDSTLRAPINGIQIVAH